MSSLVEAYSTIDYQFSQRHEIDEKLLTKNI